MLGNAILLAQCSAMAALLVLQKRVFNRSGTALARPAVPPTFLTAWSYTGAAALTFGVAGAQAAIAAAKSSSSDGDGLRAAGRALALGGDPAAAWRAVLFGVFVGISFTQVAMACVNARAGPSAVASSMTLQPPLNAVLSCLFLGRRGVTAGEFAGGTIVCAGLLLVANAPAASAAEGTDARRNDEGALIDVGEPSSSSPSTAEDERGLAEEDAESAREPELAARVASMVASDDGGDGIWNDCGGMEDDSRL